MAAKVDCGLVRDSNQDCAAVGEASRIAIVADGLGGHERGEVASRVVVDTLVGAFEGIDVSQMPPSVVEDLLRTALLAANAGVRAQPFDRLEARMGSTVVVALFSETSAVVAHLGDSRCYLFRGGAPHCLTEDHTLAAEMRREAKDSKDLAQAARFEHALTRSVGSKEVPDPEVTTVPFEPGDVFLLCSDGLWSEVTEGALAELVSLAESAHELCEALVLAAWKGGARDNIGVAVVRIV